jgi:PII-like signaling protein
LLNKAQPHKLGRKQRLLLPLFSLSQAAAAEAACGFMRLRGERETCGYASLRGIWGYVERERHAATQAFGAYGATWRERETCGYASLRGIWGYVERERHAATQAFGAYGATWRERDMRLRKPSGHLAAFGDDDQIVKKDVGLIVAVVEGHHVGADERRLL